MDHQFSGRRIGEPLRRSGHDMRALAEEPESEGLDDPSVLEIAAADERILVTRNSRAFVPILRTWVEGDREHAGCILIWSFRANEFAEIVAGVERVMAAMPTQDQWRGASISL
ncbi:MAG: DUF5615 family PIN-like protein [Gaiellaceae bacterium]